MNRAALPVGAGAGNMPPSARRGGLDRDAMKAAAAEAAVEEVTSGMVIGLGTGSTAAHAVRAVAARLGDGRLEGIVGVPTSAATDALAHELGVPLVAPGAAPIDLAIDGADEIAPDLALTKGGGGALLREKVVAAAASRFIVIADDTKLVAALGSTFDIPLEVARFGVDITTAALQRWGQPRLRGCDSEPFVTDNGNYVVDLAVEPILDAAALEAELHTVPGVLATGLFVGLAAVAYVAGSSGVRRIDAAG